MKVVFTNGCFDIIHPGHVQLLETCKKCGDYLIVGLNSDKSIKQIKGQYRPINNQTFRQKVLEALKPVDYVMVFNELTPLKLIKSIKPDVLIKGGDWSIRKIVGGDFVQSYGGIVLSLPLLEDYSTTSIIEKIKNRGTFI